MTANEKIEELAKITGSPPKVQAQAMGISVQSFYNRRNDKITGENFTEKNYIDFLLFSEGNLSILKKQIEKCKKKI